METFIQYGYIALFSVCFPLCAAMAFVSNKLEIRIDAIKLLYFHDRTFCTRNFGIGTFKYILY